MLQPIHSYYYIEVASFVSRDDKISSRVGPQTLCMAVFTAVSKSNRGRNGRAICTIRTEEGPARSTPVKMCDGGVQNRPQNQGRRTAEVVLGKKCPPPRINNWAPRKTIFFFQSPRIFVAAHSRIHSPPRLREGGREGAEKGTHSGGWRREVESYSCVEVRGDFCCLEIHAAGVLPACGWWTM